MAPTLCEETKACKLSGVAGGQLVGGRGRYGCRQAVLLAVEPRRSQCHQGNSRGGLRVHILDKTAR